MLQVKQMIFNIAIVLFFGVATASSTMKEVFTEIYETGFWGKKETRSGGGSTLLQTGPLRKLLPGFFKKYGITSLIDAPCGDFNWMKEVNLNGISYLGVDIVDALITKNQSKYTSKAIQFDCGNILEYSFPPVDLIICRDCITHLTFDQAKRAIANFKRSGAVYLLTSTYPDTKVNKDVKSGKESRPLNLQLPPFNFPKPVEIINEGYWKKNSRSADKSLGLWFLEDINLD